MEATADLKSLTGKGELASSGNIPETETRMLIRIEGAKLMIAMQMM